MERTANRYNPLPNNRCGNCGYQHTKGKCPASGQSCLKYGKPHHFARVCRSSKDRPNMKTTSAIIINAVNESDSLSRITVSVGRGFVQEPKLIPDTGAEVSVAGLPHLSQLGIKQKHLIQPNHELKHIGGGQINVLGSCEVSRA